MQEEKVNPIDELEGMLDDDNNSFAIELPEVPELQDGIDGKVMDFVAGKSDAELPVVTKKAADRLNLGLLYKNIQLILSLDRQEAKVEALEKMIYSPSGINCNKELVGLYKTEKQFYMDQMEFVRKYVLNNKAALDDLNGDVNELAKILSQLTKEQIAKVQEVIKTITSDKAVPEGTDLLEDDNI